MSVRSMLPLFTVLLFCLFVNKWHHPCLTDEVDESEELLKGRLCPLFLIRAVGGRVRVELISQLSERLYHLRNKHLHAFDLGVAEIQSRIVERVKHGLKLDVMVDSHD